MAFTSMAPPYFLSGPDFNSSAMLMVWMSATPASSNIDPATRTFILRLQKNARFPTVFLRNVRKKDSLDFNSCDDGGQRNLPGLACRNDNRERKVH